MQISQTEVFSSSWPPELESLGWSSLVAPSFHGSALCCCPHRWERFERTLLSGRQTSRPSSKRPADAWVSRSTISSSVPRQSSANCRRSWDSARPLSSPCPGGPFLSTSATSGKRRSPGCRPWPHLWLATALPPWTRLTRRRETSPCSDTSSPQRKVKSPFKISPSCSCASWQPCWKERPRPTKNKPHFPHVHWTNPTQSKSVCR